ncbi:SDR family oxidoreductase [Pantoea sp. 1.19]|uniref:SDR family oxidoreductase n=1 Tax=Pantoea sp. 1.19 TaxID=1925589 RepID=UPI0009491951|nr:SDR family oxidoreductase [Pantoea sp. 1.19]
MKLDQRHILLTGAGGGIGQALSHSLAEQGARLTLHGRNPAALEALRARLPHPERHCIWCADLGDTARLQQEAGWFAQRPALDIVINNAGTSHFAWLSDQNDAQISQQLLINVQAPILLTRMLLPYLNRPALIMNVGSSFGSIGYAGFSVYCASKFALRGFSEALRRELAGTGLEVLYFAPRATQTAINSAAVNAMNSELGTRSDTPEYVARQIVIALQRQLTRRWLGWPERFFVTLNALFPGLVDKALSKQRAIIARHANASLSIKRSS